MKNDAVEMEKMSQKILIKVKPKEEIEKLSSFDMEIENYVAKKRERILEVVPIVIDNQTYYKDENLDYWHFTEQMIEIIKIEETLKQIYDLMFTRKISIVDILEYHILKCDKVIYESYHKIYPMEYEIKKEEDVQNLREEYYDKIKEYENLLSLINTESNIF